MRAIYNYIYGSHEILLRLGVEMRKDTGISLRQNVPFKQVPRVLHTVALGVAIYLRSRGGLLHPFGKTFGQLHNDSKGSALPPEGGGGTGESAASLSISSFPSQIQHGGNGGSPESSRLCPHLWPREDS